jgi:hypothetical protein
MVETRSGRAGRGGGGALSLPGSVGSGLGLVRSFLPMQSRRNGRGLVLRRLLGSRCVWRRRVDGLPHLLGEQKPAPS